MLEEFYVREVVAQRGPGLLSAVSEWCRSSGSASWARCGGLPICRASTRSRASRFSGTGSAVRLERYRPARGIYQVNPSQ